MVVAVSSTANVRRGAPLQPALTAGETGLGEAPHARVRAPRPWTASLQRPAAKILVAGGLTLAGWLLGAALSGSTASAAEQPACPQAPAVSTVDHSAKPFAHGRHRKSHRETGADACTAQPKRDTGSSADPDETPSTAETPPPSETQPAVKTSPLAETTQPVGEAPEQQADETPAAPLKNTKDTAAAEEPAVTMKATSSGGDLLGGLVGGVLNVVGGTLTTVTSTVGAVTNTLSHTVLAPLTQPIGGNPNAPVLLPLDDVLAPVFGGSSNSGGVTAIVPGLVTGTATQAAGAVLTETAPVAAPATAAVPQQSTSRVAVARPVVLRHQDQLPVVQERPRDSGVHATTGGGGDSTPGLPGGSTAPSAPAPVAAPGHDGPGGARHAFAVHTDDVTTTQLKLIGTSRDHEVDGAGREAALPTTSPD
ncbi:hypothetical protein CF165_00480 [Amycolatopsis vastitatis]|uniref:Uncharacterized protein n=1 Tax=Amycolatopsis vastitatis TaxID=1905142 RepID=A0A229TK05_9PSEU|nr:hypothetical protein CF165_00480 [Amycolatopsis vastitatis]